MKNSKLFVLMLVACLLGCQLALYLGIESLLYAATVVVAGLYVARRPREALWVTFFLLAITSQLYQIQLDERLRTALPGAYRPYLFVIVVVAGSMLVGLLSRQIRIPWGGAPQCRGVRDSIVAFTAIFLLALACDYFNSVGPPGLLDVFRDSSGLMTFLAFFFLGFWLSTSLNESQQAFQRLSLSVLAYSVFFVAKFLFLSSSSDAAETAAGFGYSQRNFVFFSGLVLVVLLARVLSREVAWTWQRGLPVALALLLAVLFSGSRSVFACALAVPLLFVPVWRSKTRLRLALMGLAAGLALFIGPSLQEPLQIDSQEGMLGYVSHRFLSPSAGDTSLLGRESEMAAVADTIAEHPLLGRGPGASYSFFDPLLGWRETTFVDSGLGYLLMKTGLLGTAAFFWFALGWLRMERALRRVLPGLTVASVASFAFFMVFLPFGTSFFELQYSWFIGLVMGHSVSLASTLWGQKLTTRRVACATSPLKS
jgi:O-antigen ligase